MKKIYIAAIIALSLPACATKTGRTVAGMAYAAIPGAGLIEAATAKEPTGPGVVGRQIGDTYAGDFSADTSFAEVDPLLAGRPDL